MPERRTWRDHPLAQLVRARVIEFAREPEAVFWTFFFPIILAVALGLAFRGGAPKPVPVAVIAGPAADSLHTALEASRRADPRVLERAAAHEALRRGDVAVVVESRADGSMLYRFDDTRAESRTARLIVDDVLQRAAGRDDVHATSDELVTEKGSRYIDFLMPGLIGLNLLSTGLWFVGYTVVKMRTDRLLKRFVTTPVRRSHFLLSFMLGRLLFLSAELVVVLTFARFVFGVPIRGSLLTLALTAMIGAFTFTGLGLLIGSRARTVEGVQGLLNLASVPMWVLSGVFFASSNFPDIMQPFIQALPLTALNNALRAVMLEGATIFQVSGFLGILLAWGAACFAAAIALFRWR